MPGACAPCPTPRSYLATAPMPGICARLAPARPVPSPTVASLYPVAYNVLMVEIRQTEAYARWFRRLRDRQARVRIDNRIRRMSLGNLGDVRPVGEGVSEVRIDYGPGYRVYFMHRGGTLIVLLAGGD